MSEWLSFLAGHQTAEPLSPPGRTWERSFSLDYNAQKSPNQHANGLAFLKPLLPKCNFSKFCCKISPVFPRSLILHFEP